MSFIFPIGVILFLALIWWLRDSVGFFVEDLLAVLGIRRVRADVRSEQLALYEECVMRYGDDWRRNYRLVLAEARRRGVAVDDIARLEITQELLKVFEEGRWIDSETINAQWRNSL